METRIVLTAQMKLAVLLTRPLSAKAENFSVRMVHASTIHGAAMEKRTVVTSRMNRTARLYLHVR